MLFALSLSTLVATNTWAGVQTKIVSIGTPKIDGSNDYSYRIELEDQITCSSGVSYIVNLKFPNNGTQYDNERFTVYSMVINAAQNQLTIEIDQNSMLTMGSNGECNFSLLFGSAIPIKFYFQ